MSITLAPETQILLQNDFTGNAPLNPSIWSYPTGAAEYIPSALGPNAPGTETQPYLPSVSNGALQLPLQTYNPTSQPPGTSFQGSAIYTNQSFTTTTAVGIAFTAIAQLGTTIPGMDGGIFAYENNSSSSTNLHSEIDFESLSDNAANQSNQELTNIYFNQPTNSVGNPAYVSDPSLTTYQTYTIEWFPSEVLWFINGQLVRQSTVDVPQGSLQFYLNLWAYDAGASLQPTANPAANQTYTFDVQSVSVASIADVNTTLTINGTVPNQQISDQSSLSPFSNVVIADLNAGQTVTATVTLSDAANGTLSNLGGGSYNAATGVYTDTGTAAGVTAALDSLVFTPTTHQVGPGQTVTTAFTIADSDTAGATAIDSTTTVVATALDQPTSYDFNRDGDSDILWQDTNGQAAIWLMNGTTPFDEPVVGANPGPSWQVVGAGDFYGGDQADILWQNTNGQPAIWVMNGTTPVGEPVVGANPEPSWQIVGTGDFNGDGDTDILWQNTNGQPAIWLMNGTTPFSEPVVGANPGPSWHIVGTGDFNGDGDADILWQNTDGQAAIWLMNGTTPFSEVLVGSNPGPSWRIVGAGNFGGNGDTDIVWQNTDGQASIWVMNGTTPTSEVLVGANPGPSWQIVSTGAFNGGSQSDLLWQNTNGQASIWLMNGTTPTSEVLVGSNPGPTWHIR